MYEVHNCRVTLWRVSHLKECLSSGGSGLEHDGEDGEDDDLDGGTASVPVGSTDTILQH